LEWRELSKVGPGLQNLGNTCFLNATLQCLLYCPPLVQHLLNHKYGAPAAAQQAHHGRAQLNLVSNTAAVARSSAYSAISPKTIVANIRTIGKQFRPGRQEDAHEFLRKLVDSMAEAILRRHGVKANAPHRLDETTAINRVFGGYLRNQVQCTKCRYCSNTYELYMDLSLDMVGNISSLEDALKRFQAVETLDSSNRWRCGGCKQKVCARKQLTIHTAPNALVLHLKRFAYGRQSTKIRRHVAYPEHLDLKVSGPEKRVGYDLCGVVVHEGGTMQFGHYFAYIRASNKLWYRMDDAHVKSTRKSRALEQQAYMLFYTRTPDPAAAAATA
ncbi:hypothetical protein JKP88DRAFT_333792, partial [Tribonema minus]